MTSIRVAGASKLELLTACDLCDNGEFADVFVSHGFRLVRCRNCGNVFTNPRLTASALAAKYREEYYEKAAALAASQLEPPSRDEVRLGRELMALANRRTEYDPPTVLDVGAGHGRLVAGLAAAGWKALGVEPSESACRIAQSFGRDIRPGTLENIELPEAGTLGAITAMHVLEHAASPRRFLTACQDLLAPGGLLLLETPDFGSRIARSQGPDWKCLFPEIHLFQFTKPVLDRYLRKAGFEPLRWRRVGGRGFLGESPPPSRYGNATRNTFRWREAIFASRKLIYRIPWAQNAVRWFLWECLGQAESLQVVGRAR